MEQANSPDFDLRALLGIIGRQSKIIIYTIISILIVTLAYLFTVTPKYTAVALLSIEPNREVLAETSSTLNNTGAISATVEGEAQIIKSNDVLLALIQSQNLLRDEEFGISPSNWDKLRNIVGLEVEETADGARELLLTVSRLRNAITVRRKGLTYLIEVGITSENPDKAARLANALATEYIGQQIQQKIERTVLARDILSRQVDVAKRKLESVELRVDGFLTDFIDDFVRETGREDLREMQLSLNAVTQELEASRERLSALSDATSSKPWDRLSEDLMSDAMRTLVQQRRALNERLAAEQETGIDAAVLKAELESLEEDLAAIATADLSATRLTVSEFQSSQDRMRDDLRASVLNADLPAGALTDLYQLQQQGGIARNQYQDLLQRLSQLDTLASLQIADATLVSKALAPTGPSFPRKNLILALALTLAFGLGLGLGFLNEYFVGGFTSEEQLRDFLKVRDVISIPSNSKGDESDKSKTILNAPLSIYSESFRQLKKSTEKALRGRERTGGQTITIASAIPAEGKSTTALALGRTFAKSGATTILVDLDLRKPSLGLQAGKDKSEALLDFLSGKIELSALAENISIEDGSNLAVLTGGGRPDAPTDSLIGSQRLRDLIEGLRAQFDYVILDTAPVLPLVDTLYLLDQADVVLQLVRFASTNQRDVWRAHTRLAQEVVEGVEIIPVLSMEMSQRSASYSYRGYYAGYGGYTTRSY